MTTPPSWPSGEPGQPPAGNQPYDPSQYGQQYGQAQPYGQQPYAGPPYAAQPYPGQPADPYGAPAGYGANPYGMPPGAGLPPTMMVPMLRRPGILTAAAVLAFITGALRIIVDLAALDIVSSHGELVLLLILDVIVGAILIFGGVQALTGKDSRILVVGAVLAILVGIAAMVMIAYMSSQIAGFLIPILILIFALSSQARTWVRARGGKAFG